MKKIIALLLALACIPTLFAAAGGVAWFPTSEIPPVIKTDYYAPIRGDVNLDGKFSGAADALSVLKRYCTKTISEDKQDEVYWMRMENSEYLKQEPLSYVRQLAANVDQKNGVNAADALAILRHAVGKETPGIDWDTFPLGYEFAHVQNPILINDGKTSLDIKAPQFILDIYLSK